MEKYIALLRGINVGGNNVISQKELKAEFEKHFTNVITYINSGNIIFQSESAHTDEITKVCEKLILQRFSLNIIVNIISAKDFALALANAPKWWNVDANSKHNALFVIKPLTAKEAIKIMGETKPEYEKIDHHGQLIYWSAPISTFSKTTWSKIAKSPIYKSITIRNANTTLKLLELIK